MTQRGQVLYPDAYTDDEIIIPGKRKPTGTEEWRLQAKCATIIRRRMRTDKSLRFIASMAENHRTKARAAMAKMMGMEPGVADLILIRRTADGYKLAWVELKRPGKPLSDTQKDWVEWWGGRIPCYRCDNKEDFKVILADL